MTAPTIHPVMQSFMWFAPPCRATGNHLASANDEPEPRSFADIHAEGLREVQAVMREPLNPEKRK